MIISNEISQVQRDKSTSFLSNVVPIFFIVIKIIYGIYGIKLKMKLSGG